MKSRNLETWECLQGFDATWTPSIVKFWVSVLNVQESLYKRVYRSEFEQAVQGNMAQYRQQSFLQEALLGYGYELTVLKKCLFGRWVEVERGQVKIGIALADKLSEFYSGVPRKVNNKKKVEDCKSFVGRVAIIIIIIIGTKCLDLE